MEVTESRGSTRGKSAVRSLDWTIVPKPQQESREEEEEQFGFRHPELQVLAGPPKRHICKPFGIGSVALRMVCGFCRITVLENVKKGKPSQR